MTHEIRILKGLSKTSSIGPHAPIDDNLLAMYIEGKLTPIQNQQLSALIARHGHWRQRWLSLKSLPQYQTRPTTLAWAMLASAACLLLVTGIWFINPVPVAPELMAQTTPLPSQTQPAKALAYQGVSQAQWQVFLSAYQKERSHFPTTTSNQPFFELAQALLNIGPSCKNTDNAQRIFAKLAQQYPRDFGPFTPVHPSQWCLLAEKLTQYARLAVKARNSQGMKK
ncbi:MAG: hypothetical protein RPR91_10715 [Colwellia sp.]|jgi:hypothetical protein